MKISMWDLLYKRKDTDRQSLKIIHSYDKFQQHKGKYWTIFWHITEVVKKIILVYRKNTVGRTNEKTMAASVKIKRSSAIFITRKKCSRENRRTTMIVKWLDPWLTESEIVICVHVSVHVNILTMVIINVAFPLLFPVFDHEIRFYEPSCRADSRELLKEFEKRNLKGEWEKGRRCGNARYRWHFL